MMGLGLTPLPTPMPVDVTSCEQGSSAAVPPPPTSVSGPDPSVDSRCAVAEDELETDDCAICLMPLDTAVTRLDCGHRLHEACVNQLRGHMHVGILAGDEARVTCPLCRQPLDVEADPAELAARAQDSSDLETAVAAVRALGRMREKAVPYIGALVMRVGDAKIDMRRVVVWALAQLSTVAATSCAEPLVNCLGDTDIGIRHCAGEALKRIGEPGAVAIAMKITRLGTSQVAQRNGLRALAEMPVLGAKALADFFEDPDPKVRQRAVFAVGQLDEAASTLSEKLVAMFQDNDPAVRKFAAVALGRCNTADAASHAGKLAPLLRDHDASVRASAAEALGSLGQASALYVSSLVELLSYEENGATERSKIVAAIGKIGASCRCAEDGSWAFPEEGRVMMARLIIDGSDDVRTSTIAALSQMGLMGAAVLASQLRHRDVAKRGACVDSLRSMGVAGAAAFASQLMNSDATVRCVAAGALGRMGEEAVFHWGALDIACQDPDEGVRGAARSALMHIPASKDGHTGEEVASALAKQIQMITQLTDLENKRLKAKGRKVACFFQSPCHRT